MKLPNREQAYIANSKITGYLLADSHPAGQSKARFFRLAGFDETTIDHLRDGLLRLAQEEDVIEIKNSPHGTKYVIDGTLTSPNGNLVQIRTVWIIDIGQYAPRLVTAYAA